MKSFQFARSAKAAQSFKSCLNGEKRRNRSIMNGLWGSTMDHLEVRQLLTTYYVDNFSDDTTGSGSNGTLRWAVAQANTLAGDDTILFSSTSQPQTITLTAANGPIVIKDSSGGNLLINGLGQSNLTISGGNVTGLFLVKSPTSISNMTMTNGNGAGTLGGAKSGGAILNISCLTLDHISIYNSSVTNGYGGAIASSYGGSDYPNDITANVSLVATNLVISNTTSGPNSGFGGAIYSGAHNSGTSTNLILINSCISNTYAKTGGGAINHQTGYYGGTANLLISNVTLANTSSGMFAGGILIGASSYSNVTIDKLKADKSFSGSGGVRGGGLLYAEVEFFGANRTFIKISNSTISNTSATNGGVFLFKGGNIVVRDTSFTNTTATNNGGLIQIDSGNVLSPAVLNISNISVNNTTASYGGGIYVANSVVSIDKMNLTNA